MKQLLIVGLDPGTTVGYAILDIMGKCLATGSGKDLQLRSLLQRITAFGTPLILGCDKHKIPGLVESFAAKFGAVIVSPDHDLLVEEKKTMTAGFSVANNHEMDALASALFAWKKYQPLMEKIQRKLKDEKKESLLMPVTEYVVKHGISIKAAMMLIERPEEPSAKIITKVVHEKQLTREDFVQLYEELIRLRQANAFLRKQYQEAEAKIKKKERRLAALEEKLVVLPEQKAGRLLQQKEARVHLLEKELKQTRERLAQVQQQLQKLPNAIAALQPVVVLTKLPTLGWNKAIEQIREGDVLLVEDPNIVSKYAVAVLSAKVQYVLYKKPLSKKIANELPFVFLDATQFTLLELDRHAFVNQQALSKHCRKRSVQKACSGVSERAH